MSTLDLNKTFNEVYRLLEALEDPANMKELVAEAKAKRARRIARHEGRVAILVAAMSDHCELLVHAYEREGAKVNKYFQHRSSRNVAVMLTKTAWDGVKGRMGRKLIVVYPDGTRSETFERTITVRTFF